MRSAIFRSIQASATENEVLGAKLVPRVSLYLHGRGFHNKFDIKTALNKTLYDTAALKTSTNMTTTELKGVTLTYRPPPPLGKVAVEESFGSMERWSLDSRGTRSRNPRDLSAAGGSERLEQNGLKAS